MSSKKNTLILNKNRFRCEIDFQLTIRQKSLQQSLFFY